MWSRMNWRRKKLWRMLKWRRLLSESVLVKKISKYLRINIPIPTRKMLLLRNSNWASSLEFWLDGRICLQFSGVGAILSLQRCHIRGKGHVLVPLPDLNSAHEASGNNFYGKCSTPLLVNHNNNAMRHLWSPSYNQNKVIRGSLNASYQGQCSQSNTSHYDKSGLIFNVRLSFSMFLFFFSSALLH